MEYRVAADMADLPVFSVAAHQNGAIILNYSSGPLKPNSATRFTVFAKRGATVIGGSTFVLRSRDIGFTRQSGR